MTATDSSPAGFLRRTAALVYDLFLLAAILFAAAIPPVLIFHDALHGLARLGFQVYLLAVSGVFFTVFWTRGGQTLGMRAWRLRVEDAGGVPPRPARAWLRFGVALASFGCAALGFLWMLVDPQHRTWHDIASGTRVVVRGARGGARETN